nr:glycosyltransferase [Lachnospiraceae bacterium]
MIRVLHVFGVLDMGGAESRIMDIYRHIDRSRVQFDFVVHGDKKGDYEDEVHSLGGRVFRVPKFRIFNYFSYKAAFKELFSEYKDEFKAVHGHMTSTASIYLPIAKKAGIPECAAHARSAGTDPGFKGKVTRLMRKNLWKKADHLFACSKVAGISVFGQKAYDRGKVQFVPNAIRVGLFAFNKDQRNEIRKSLNVEDKYVIGHVGRFHYSKNHIFLIDVFASIIQKTKDKGIDPVLLLVGEGPLMGEVKDHVEELGISDKVIFAGAKKDVYKYYNAMDFFLYPSRYEGLPGTVVEAQA